MVIVLRCDSFSDLHCNKLNIMAGGGKKSINGGDITTHHAGWLHHCIFGCCCFRRSKTWRAFSFCLGSAQVCEKEGALLQFVPPCFIYTVTKSRCTSVKHKLRDMAVWVFHILKADQIV